MRTILCIILALSLMTMLFGGCFTMTHVVGDGSKTATTETARQWYILWGLVPLNKVDSKSMAGGATNYTIVSEYTAVDFILNIFTSFVTIESMTVQVSK